MPADDGIEDELALLRRRAYAPDADIGLDADASMRLHELEERARIARLNRIEATRRGQEGRASARDGARAAELDPAGSDPEAREGASVADDRDRESSGDATPAPHHRRPAGHTAAVVTVAVVACALAAAAVGMTPPDANAGADAGAGAAPSPSVTAVSPLQDEARTLIELPIDGGPVNYFGEVEQDDPPVFPIPEGLSWAESYGTYFGWDVWLARAQGGAPCIAAVRGEDVISRCAVSEPFGPDGVSVLVPFSSLTPEDRPEGMLPADNLAFWWPAGGVVRVEVGPPTDAAAGAS